MVRACLRAFGRGAHALARVDRVPPLGQSPPPGQLSRLSLRSIASIQPRPAANGQNDRTKNTLASSHLPDSWGEAGQTLSYLRHGWHCESGETAAARAAVAGQVTAAQIYIECTAKSHVGNFLTQPGLGTIQPPDFGVVGCGPGVWGTASGQRRRMNRTTARPDPRLTRVGDRLVSCNDGVPRQRGVLALEAEERDPSGVLAMVGGEVERE